MGSAEQAKVLIDVTDIRVNSATQCFFKGLSPQRKTEDERASNRVFTASKKGRKTPDNKRWQNCNGTPPIPMEIHRDHNNMGTKPSNSEALNAAAGINIEKEDL